MPSYSKYLKEAANKFTKDVASKVQKQVRRMVYQVGGDVEMQVQNTEIKFSIGVPWGGNEIMPLSLSVFISPHGYEKQDKLDVGVGIMTIIGNGRIPTHPEFFSTPLPKLDSDLIDREVYRELSKMLNLLIRKFPEETADWL